MDLIDLLPPPPQPGGAQDVADKAAAIREEHDRTPERVAQAVSDDDKSVFVKFGSVMGLGFTPAALPLTAHLFERLTDTEEAVTRPAKIAFARPRPFVANTALHPVMPPSKTGSYPSGHATGAAIMAVVLGDMAPEMRAAIFARADDYAESRVIAGEHYPTDIRAGREAGIAIAAVLAHNLRFLAEYGPARKELRAAMGLPK